MVPARLTEVDDRYPTRRAGIRARRGRRGAPEL